MTKIARLCMLIAISMILFFCTAARADLSIHSSNSFVAYSSNSSDAQNLSIVSSKMTQMNRFSTELILASEESNEEVAPAINGDVLVYPNPFRFSEGAEIGFELSKDMDTEIKFYDMRAFEIHSIQYTAGNIGGSEGYNRVPVNNISFPRPLPSGLYYFIVFNNGELMGKGKLVVKV